MLESILNTIKKMLGVLPEYTAFDVDIIVHINSAFMVLHQLGVGPETVFSIENANTEWPAFLGENPEMYSAVKSYIYLKVKQIFDPPSTSFVLASMEKQIQELEWRLSIQVPIPPEEIIEEEL